MSDDTGVGDATSGSQTTFWSLLSAAEGTTDGMLSDNTLVVS